MAAQDSEATNPAKRPQGEPAAESLAKSARLATGAEAVEAELARGTEELRQQVKSAQDSEAAGWGAGESALDALAALLRRLAELPVGAEMLRRTGAGREVNQRWIRCHSHEGIRAAGQALVHCWRAAAGVESSKAAALRGPPEAPLAAGSSMLLSQEVGSSGAGSGDVKAELAAAFRELAGFEFKRKQRFKGAAYQKVSRTLLAMGEEISSVDQVKHLPGVGPQSQRKIAEYLETSKIQRLERYRQGDFDGED